MHIYARFSQFRIIADKKKCISCNVCTSVCHQGIDVMNFANKGLPDGRSGVRALLGVRPELSRPACCSSGASIAARERSSASIGWLPRPSRWPS